MSESARNKSRYNIVALDEEKLKGDSYKLRSYPTASENNPRDQFYRYEANRNDPNLFVSGAYNETRTQIHDATYTEFKKNDINVIEINESKNSYSIVQGFNTDEQKTYGYVFERLRANPTQTVTFTEQQSMDLVSKTGMYIRNIKIYGSNIGVKNSYMPVTIIAPSDFQGYRSQLSSSGVTTAFDVTKVHHEGDIKASMQSPFTNQHVGGYSHRHHPINTGSDNSFNRPEMVSLDITGTQINFTSPLGTVPNYSKLAVRYSREGGAKRVVNTKRIKTTDSRIAGNYTENYEVFQATNRNENNMWFRDHPTASFPLIDSPYISGTQDTGIQDFKLANDKYNQSIIAQRFGAPGGPESNAYQGLDPLSRQFSPYNTVNYRNPSIRYYLNKQFLVNHSEYGGYTTAGFGLTASFHGIQRNPSYYITGSGVVVKKYDNAFVKREIPASPRGYKWIKTRFGTSSFDNNIFVKDYNDPGITFLSKSIDRNLYFQNLSVNSLSEQLVKSASYSDYSSTITGSNFDLNSYLVSKEKLLGFSTYKQVNNRYNKTLNYTRKRNIVGNIDDKKQFKYIKHSPINSKYNNVIIEFKNTNELSEELSLPFASHYSFYGDFFKSGSSQIDNLYKDERNIKFSNKSDSMFFKILDIDNQRRQNNVEFPKINKVKYKERIWPKVSEAYRILCYQRTLLPFIPYTYAWIDKEIDRTYNSPGKVDLLSNTATNVGQLSYYPVSEYSGSDNTKPGSGSVMFRNETEVFASMWPMDAFTTTSGSVLNDQSGVLMTLDNALFVSSTYPDVGFPIHLKSSRADSKYYSELSHFGRNFNVNRPKNTVHENANSYPLYESVQTISDDIARNFKDYSIITSYDPRVILSGHYEQAFKLPNDYEYLNAYNSFIPLNGGISEEFLNEIRTSPTNFVVGDGTYIVPNYELESRIYSDFIDLFPDFNQNQDLKISKLKVNLNVVKKFSPLLQFYPTPFLAYTLSKVYYSYYVYSGEASPAFSSSVNLGYSKPKTLPFLHPGILFNSIKAGAGLPYSIVTASLGNDVISLTGSLTGAYYKVPWDAILDPAKIAGITYYEADPDINTPSSGSYTLLSGYINDKPYKQTANNFLSEVVNTFLKDGILPRLKSKPQTSWYFPDLTKDYSMKIVINKTPNFTTYSSLESFGHRPYIFHNPPWMTTSGDATIDTVTGASFNSDVNLAPSSSWEDASYAIATLTFKPSQITASAGVQITAGKGAQISFNEIKKHTTVAYESSFVTSSTIANGAINLGDCVEIFGFSDKEEAWTPYVKWACPTANLNFSGSQGKTTGSNSYDSGLSPGHAVRGVMHQLGLTAKDDEGLFFSVQDNSSSSTGSLAEIVGFDLKERVRIGDVASSITLSEGLIVVPIYLENETEEKLLSINIDKFEKNYTTSQYIKSVDDFSKKYVLPPLLDFMRVRRNSKTPLTKKDYGKVASPFVFFFEEYKTVLTKSDLLRFWQGLIPEVAAQMEIDNKTVEWDLNDNPIFSYDDLVKFGGTLPKNLRFKVFKVVKRAEKNYQNIVDKTLGNPVKEDYTLSMNWPHGYYEIANMAKVDVELEYNKTFGIPKGFHVDKDGKSVKDEDAGK